MGLDSTVIVGFAFLSTHNFTVTLLDIIPNCNCFFIHTFFFGTIKLYSQKSSIPLILGPHVFTLLSFDYSLSQAVSHNSLWRSYSGSSWHIELSPQIIGLWSLCLVLYFLTHTCICFFSGGCLIPISFIEILSSKFATNSLLPCHCSPSKRLVHSVKLLRRKNPSGFF